jgi:formylglycine-generating enzyme required for sulfatase activity
MKLGFVILIMFLAVVAQPALPQEANGPLGKDQVLDLVKFGLASGELAKRIKERGIDFEPTEDYLETLRKAGAQEAVIQALREARPQPLTREQVGKLVAGGVPSQRAVALVKQHGIDFVGDERYLQTLRVAGGDDTLIAALREASAAATGELVVLTSPNAEVYWDGELLGRADAQGELTTKSKLGAHALKVTLAGKKDFEQNITLAARQATKIQARLEDLPPSPGTVRENPKDGLKYLWIPPGTFMMGCSPGDNGCFDNEKPSHQVTITKGFWLGQTEVTVGAYKRLAAATGRQMPPEPNFNGRMLNPGWGDEAMPIVDVTWDEAQAYCGWAGGRLPTEAEWEYAARGGSTGAHYGDLDEIAWYADNSGSQRLDSASILKAEWANYLKRLNENGNGLHDVGLKRANGFGLYDILGNVWEWVNDWYDQNYYQSSPSQDPTGPASGQFRVLRGGSWFYNPGFVRVSDRFSFSPGNWDFNFGFRCGGEVFVP